MDRIDVMRLFARIVERASFSVAARDLRVPRASVSRAMQQLETELGVRLLERTTRTVRPTEDGSRYYARCVALLEQLDDLEGSFGASEPRGTVCANLQGTLARFFVLPALPDFMARHPMIDVRLSETDRMVDLVTEGIDCVLRAGDLPDSSLVGRQVAMMEQATLASPDYLERHGTPKTLADLEGHRMVAYIASATGEPYPLDFTDDGVERAVPLPHDLMVTGAEIYTAACLAGLGLIQVPRYRVAHHLATGDLVSVLDDHRPPAMPVSVLYPQSRNLPSRIRAFVDWLGEVFQAAQQQGRL